MVCLLDAISGQSQLRHWPQLHIARAGLLARLGRARDAVAAYQAALQLEPPAAEQAFIRRRIGQLQEAPGG